MFCVNGFTIFCKNSWSGVFATNKSFVNGAILAKGTGRTLGVRLVKHFLFETKKPRIVVRAPTMFLERTFLYKSDSCLIRLAWSIFTTDRMATFGYRRCQYFVFIFKNFADENLIALFL